MFETDHIRIDPAYAAALRAAGLDSVAGALARVEGDVVAWSRSTETLRIAGSATSPGFFLKRYYFRPWRKRLRGMFRGTFFGMHRGQAEYASLNEMRSRGIPAVRPVAHGARRIGHFLAACFLITEEVPDATNLTALAADFAAGRAPLRPAQRRAMIRTLARETANMHASGFLHGNLFWRNILARVGLAGEPEFFFLDAQPPPRWQRRGPGRWWLRELAQLAVSALAFTTPRERYAFLRTYLGERQDREEVRTCATEIEQRAERWARHEQRRIAWSERFDEWKRRLAGENPPRTPVGAEQAGA